MMLAFLPNEEGKRPRRATNGRNAPTSCWLPMKLPLKYIDNPAASLSEIGLPDRTFRSRVGQRAILSDDLLKGLYFVLPHPLYIAMRTLIIYSVQRGNLSLANISAFDQRRAGTSQVSHYESILHPSATLSTRLNKRSLPVATPARRHVTVKSSAIPRSRRLAGSCRGHQ
jgi:hypothetical protein